MAEKGQMHNLMRILSESVQYSIIEFNQDEQRTTKLVNFYCRGKQ